MTAARALPCWYDRWLAERRLSENSNQSAETHLVPDAGTIEPAELRLSVVLPAFNEAERIVPALEEAVKYLDEHVGRGPSVSKNGARRRQNRSRSRPSADLSGYEILVVNDGSADQTAQVALDFAKKHNLDDSLRVITLAKNRGKGGSVTHGMRHVRGEYVLFADADGASRFSDVGKLIEGCDEVVDGSGRGVAIGSRAHLVGSEAVVKV